MAMHNPNQKRVKIHWEARWETYNHSDYEKKVEQFTGEDMEPRCRIFAQQKALELHPKWSGQDHKTRVTVHEVETWEEELGSYSYKSVMQEMTKTRNEPASAPEPPDPSVFGLTKSGPDDEIPF